MEIFFTILIMTLVVSLSGVVTRVMPFQIPLPLMQIAIGALLAWPTFGLHVEFDPELFLVLFIPPLLFADGWKTPTREFLEHGRDFRPRAGAGGGHRGRHWLPYLLGGAGHSADPRLCAGGGTFSDRCCGALRDCWRRAHPEKIMGILQGEALMNDASGLVSLKFAVAVAMGTMIFTVGGATVEFMKVAIGGILAGFVVSWLYGRSLRFLSRWGGDEPATQIVLLFLLPFASYLIAEHIGVSGILAAVAAGMTITRSGVMRRAPLAMRLRANSTWAMLEFVFNGMVFLLLGLQLPGILETSLMAAEIDPNVEIWMLFTDIILIYAALMLVRFGWLWTMKKFSNRFLKKKPMEFGSWTTREILIASFAGVRGAITLAGVLSIPLLLPDGNVFPARYELVFLAAGVILFSLFVGVVMLPILLQHIEVADHSQQLKEERIARAATAEVAIVAIQKMEERLAADTEENIDNQLLTEVSSRVIGNLRRRADGRNDVESSVQEENLERRFRLAALRSERAELYHLRATREISNETLQKLLHDLDLLEALLIEENQ